MPLRASAVLSNWLLAAYSSCRPTLPSLPHISFFSHRRRRLHLNPSASLAIPHRTQSSRRFPGSRQFGIQPCRPTRAQAVPEAEGRRRRR